jgi:hypothetical protein
VQRFLERLKRLHKSWSKNLSKVGSLNHPHTKPALTGDFQQRRVPDYFVICQFLQSLAKPTENMGKSQDSCLEAPTTLLNDRGLGQN